MKKSFITLITLLALLCTQCTSNRQEVAETHYSEFVAAYTSGSISRNAEVRLLLTQPLREGQMDSIKPAEVMKITPAVEGTYAFADDHTVTFRPTQSMARATSYRAEVALDRLYPGAAPFEFGFQTRPFALNGHLKSFDVNDAEEYLLTFALQTADAEDAKEVEGHVVPSLTGDVSWSHAADGSTHLMTLRVKPKTETLLEIQTVADKALNLEQKPLTEVELPSCNNLSVVSLRCKEGDSKCVELILNKNLDTKQNISGLVYIEDRSSKAVVEGNKVLLYADLQEGETITVVLSDKLRSTKGKTLGKEGSTEGSQTLKLKIVTDKPAVELVGDGTIIPQSERILIPFRSIYMRGVRVAVYKVFGNMMGTVMQRGDLDSTDGMCYAGRPVAMTTFMVDDASLDLSEWHTFAIDLTDQMKLEPGAMYHIELSLDARLSAWPCDTLKQATAEEMALEDEQLMAKMCDRFDQGYYFYTGMTYDVWNWWVDDYSRLHENPASSYYYDNRTVGRNVLATNIGLSAQLGSDQQLSVTAINLPDAQPIPGVKVEVYSLQQQLLGTASTNDHGVAQIAYSNRLGKPTYLVARKGDDVSYLKVSSDVALSTSTFDVSGSVVERGLKGYIYGDRGVWRPGDTLHLAFMLNDKSHTLPAEHPVSMRLSNPLGQVTHRMTRNEGAMGLYTFNIPTAQDAPTGIWSAQIQVGGVTFAKNLRIETIKPNRLKIDLDLPKGALSSGSTSAKLHTEWLNGNVAGGLKYDISATIIETPTGWKIWPGYTFDDPTKSFDTSEQQVAKGEVGQQGDASCLLNLNTGKTSPGMLKASLVTHVYEPSGEFSVDVLQTLIAPYQRMVGVKAPQQSKQGHLDTDRDHTFQVASVDKDGHAVPDVKVKVDVYKVNWYWWWSSSREDMAGYTASSYHKPVKSFDLVTDKDGKGDFKLKMTEANWGTYLIRVEDSASGHSAGVLSYFDWPWMTSRRGSSESENATSLALTTDKKEYAPGEKIRIQMPSGEGSRAIVGVCNGSKILQLDTYPCQKGNTEIVIEATEEMTPNVYIVASLVQPYSQTENDMPIRLYGLTPISVTSAKSHLTPVIVSKDEFLPESPCQVTVSEKEGRPMSYTLAIVDEGLLDLTRFKTPDAWAVFNAREALGVRFWDLYSHVNGAYGGRIEQLFSIGGDEALNNTPKAIVNRFTPMVHFSGPYTLKKGETKTHKVNVPNYNGRVRVMVVAGDGQAYGSADKSVLVRRPLMLIGTMPRQIGRGDEMTVSATVFASQQLGEVKVNLSTSEGLTIVGEKTRTLTFNAQGDQTVQFRIRESGQKGEGMVKLVATAANGKADYTAPITVRTVSQTVSQTAMTRLEPGASYDQTLTLPGESDYNLMVGVSANQPLNLMGRISQLIAYPHGCVEQTISKAFPQLYMSDYSNLNAEQQAEVEGNIKYCIGRLPMYQTSDGGMSYWPGGHTSDAWGSAYALHFLYEASALGYYVPDDMLRQLKKYVSTTAKGWTPKQDDATAAYQLYVLAAVQLPETGAMNRMREHAAQLSARASSLLAAAYGLSGRSDIGKGLVVDTEVKDTWCWFPADVARLMALNSLGDNRADKLAEKLSQQLMENRWLSTSTSAQMLIALTNYYKKHSVGKGLKFKSELEGKKLADVDITKYAWDYKQTVGKKQVHLKLQNQGDAPIYLTTTVQGTSTQGEIQKMSNGLELTVTYTEDSGKPIDVTTLPQSTTFKAVLTLRNASESNQERLVVTHIVPAGWEILGAQPAGSVSYQDVRDDRVLSYVDQLKKGETVTIRLNLSATYAGQYYLPAVSAEAMYDASVMGCTASGKCEVK